MALVSRLSAIAFFLVAITALIGDERSVSLSLRTSVTKRSTIHDTDDAESLALVTQALVDTMYAGVVNGSARYAWNDTLGRVISNETDLTMDKRDWTVSNWIGLGLLALAQGGATIGTMIPFCRSNHRPEWMATWQCVTTGISILIGFDGAYLFGSGDSGGVERIASVGLKSESKRDLSSNFTLQGRQNWSDIVVHAQAKGFVPLHLMYDKADLYSDGSVIITNPIVTYGLDNAPIINYINNGDGFMFSIDDFTHLENESQLDKKSNLYSDDYNTITFSKGGLLSQFCRYNMQSESITMPTDLNMVHDAINNLSGYWYYNSGHRHHWIIRDKNHNNVDIAEGLLQMYSSAFTTTSFESTWNLCKSSHDEL